MSSLLDKYGKTKKIIRSNNVSYIKENNDYSFTFRGADSFIILDFGYKSSSGYTSFKVTELEKENELIISYSDRLEGFNFEKIIERGDFLVDSVSYLGVRLPVLPCNPNRFESYELKDKREYIYPLIVGQFRYMCIRTKNSYKVTINELKNTCTSILKKPLGSFSSTDKKLNKIYEAGARTINIATVKAKQIDLINNKLLVRPLTKSSNTVIYKEIIKDNDNLLFKLSSTYNPLKKSNITFSIFNLKDEAIIKYTLEELKYEEIFDFNIGVINNLVKINYKNITKEFKVNESFRIGFSLTLDDYFIIHEFIVNSNNSLKENSFKAYNGKFFISDGAKRDRLPWSGDLDWAIKSNSYTFDSKVVKDTLELMMKFRNEKGYFLATYYPEYTGKFEKDYLGYYESDIFSIWSAVNYYRYFMFTNDLVFVNKHYKKIKKSLDYEIKFIKKNNLFYQRKEASKGTWDNNLSVGSYNTYANILLSKALEFFSYIAMVLGLDDDSLYYKNISNRLSDAIHKLLFDFDNGMYKKALEYADMDNESSSLALSLNFATKEEAELIKNNYHKTYFIYGKILSLLIEGLYNYGYSKEAYKILTSKNEFSTPWGYSSYISWYKYVERKDCPMTLTECMLPPRIEGMDLNLWGDMSHPDTTINHILVGKIAGVYPIKEGFIEFSINPQNSEVGDLKVKVPTNYGLIKVDISSNKVLLEYPKELCFINKHNIKNIIEIKY